TPALLVGLLAGFAWVGLLMLLCYELIPWYQGSPAAFYVIIALALAYGIGRAWSGNRAILSRALVAAGLVGATGIVLHLAIGQLIPDWPKHQPPAWIVGLVTAVFVLLFFLQSLIWRASAHPLGRRLYVHALNGFYIGTLANRLLASLWPSQSPSPTQITKHHAP
ncbi:MAG: hypothetical protein ACO3RV_01350, partial [Luteolibacter sp.]